MTKRTKFALCKSRIVNPLPVAFAPAPLLPFFALDDDSHKNPPLRFPCFSRASLCFFPHTTNISFAPFEIKNSSVRSSKATFASGSKQFGTDDDDNVSSSSSSSSVARDRRRCDKGRKWSCSSKSHKTTAWRVSFAWWSENAMTCRYYVRARERSQSCVCVREVFDAALCSFSSLSRVRALLTLKKSFVHFDVTKSKGNFRLFLREMNVQRCIMCEHLGL